MKNLILKALYILIIGISLNVSVFAQVRLVASSDAKQVVVGQYFTVTFTLENARGSNFRAPSFVDFDVVGGPNSSTQMTIINGKRQQKMSYNYSLTSSKEGKYKLGPASITVNGKQYSSGSLEIEVVKGKKISSRAGTEESNFIIETRVDYDSAYVGQQLTLKYVLLSRQDVRSYNFNTLPKFDGFFAQELQNYRSRPEQIVRDGVPYFSRILKVVSLYPQQRGRFTIEPAQVTVGVSDGRRSNSFFFNSRLKQYRALSNTIDISVLETPRGAPVSFSGAIGDFFLGSRVDKKSITMDDAVTLTLQIRGFGDGKFIEAPEQPYTDLFDIYDPNLLQEKSEIINDRVQTTKTYEYLMIPKKTGIIKFNPEVTFYNIDSAEYETIYGQQYTIRVIKGSERELADLEKDVVDLPIPLPIGKLQKINHSFAFSNIHHTLNGLLSLGLIGLLVGKQMKNRQDNIDPAVKRNLMAKKLAVSKLSVAKLALDKGEITEFYVQLRQALQEYLADKTDQPSSQLSKNHITQLLKQYNLLDQLDPLLLIMKKGEQAIYASIAPGNEQEDYEQSIAIVGQIESSLTL